MIHHWPSLRCAMAQACIISYMTKLLNIICSLAVAILLAVPLAGCAASGVTAGDAPTKGQATASAVSKSSKAASNAQKTKSASVDENGTYTDKDHVALYIHTYGHLPSNFISKTKARKAGWVSTEGNLWDVLPGKSIGGSEFYNDDEQLPDAPRRRWTECDIDYEGGFRGAKRIVFSNDGLIFYTADHYKTFEQLY